MNKKSSNKNFHSEREGQIKFFNDLRIIADVELTHNTDGVYKGTLFEFKLTISDINKVLFQAIKYLSHKRIKGEPIPAQILLVALNEEIAYLFNSGDFLSDIEKIYAGAASKNNADFSTNKKPDKIDFSNIKGLQRLTEILEIQKYTKIHIDVFDVVGWANHYYTVNPKASKSKLFEELRTPKQFKGYIYPWKGRDIDFKYINDLLNDKIRKKELGAFYTPSPYCRKAVELVRRAIKQLPKGHDYIILDRTAGTGNLEEFLTDKRVNDITIDELNRYIDKELKTKYLQNKKDIINTFYSGHLFGDLTVGELEKHKTKISLHDYLSDNEISHAIVNTYELKEWIVLNVRLGDKVKLIIPPSAHVKEANPLVNGGDALSDHFLLGSKVGRMFISKDYLAIIDELNGYVADKKTNIILLENPPYRDSSAANTDNTTNRSSKGSFVFEEMKKDLKNLSNSNVSTARDISNQFIWSGWKHYLTKPDDYFVLFSPIKYWKSLGLGEKKFIDGFLFNREYFHAGPSAISCILWQNIDDSREKLTLKAFDIDTKRTPEQEDDEVVVLQDIEIKKTKNTLTPYFEKRIFKDDTKDGVYLDPSGNEVKRTTSTTANANKNIIAYIFAGGFSVDVKHIALVRTTIFNGRGFYLRSDNFVEKLPLFAAKLYPQKNWYERDVYFTTADGGECYLKDKNFLKTCFIFACLSQRNHCRSFNGSDGRFYKNELCFDKGTVASNALKTYKLTKEEQDLLDTFAEMLSKAKKTENYNKKYTYGTYQIDDELNTRYKSENDEWIYYYPELNTVINSLKTKLAKYYEAVIQPKLFEYELLK